MLDHGRPSHAYDAAKVRGALTARAGVDVVAGQRALAPRIEPASRVERQRVRLAQALSALYPKQTEEKRWVDGVLPDAA